MKFTSFLLTVFLLLSCVETVKLVGLHEETPVPTTSETALIILGTVQDAGSPHIACKRECCASLFHNQDPNRQVVSLGLADVENKKTFLFEATPDMTRQTKALKEFASFGEKETPDGVFLTHAHIGHYTGLMYFGKEAMNADKVPVYAMPKMKHFLQTNGPWSQLVSTQNIAITSTTNGRPIELTSNITITPLLVPHRDEYSETVGYIIAGPNKKALFIPDIDKWGKWETSIIEMIQQVDYAFLDATFYDGEEINNRDISQIPHPFIIESMTKFKDLPASEKQKIYFIHFNHTNPVLNRDSPQHQKVIDNGFNIAHIYDVVSL